MQTHLYSMLKIQRRQGKNSNKTFQNLMGLNMKCAGDFISCYKEVNSCVELVLCDNPEAEDNLKTFTHLINKLTKACSSCHYNN